MTTQRMRAEVHWCLSPVGTLLFLLVLVALLLSSCTAPPPGADVSDPPATGSQVQSISAETPARFATFNASLNRDNAGDLITDLSTPGDAQAQAVAEIIQRTNPDVLLINEFDYDAAGEAARLFQENYLGVSQNGAPPVTYPYVYQAPSNTGIPSGLDLDNSGDVGGPGDAFGFGFFPGQFGMLLLAKYPIVTDEVRTFQSFLWRDMPNALLPDDPDTPAPADWYSDEELAVFRLSSKSHWDVPINIDDTIVHALVSHPTPPVFDGPEDRNGTRNHDEIRFWADYVTPGAGDYIYDDAGNYGALPADAKFVIMGDQNADPNDGDSTDDAILQLLNNPQINTRVTPSAPGGAEQAALQGGVNADHLTNPAYDTADFNEPPGNLRVDYVLPSDDLKIIDAGIFWPEASDPLFSLVGTFPFPSSDHRLVWVDVASFPPSDPDRLTVTDVELLGEVTFDTGFTFSGTEVGGLSGIAYDPENSVYYAISDDRSQINPARFYTLTINVGDGNLQAGDVNFTGVTTLLDAGGQPFPELSLDPEGIALTDDSMLYISSEGDAGAATPIDPFVNRFTLAGEQTAELPVPEKFLPTTDNGIRNNLAFESLTLTPDGLFLYTATENALKQDGPAADVNQASRARVLKYDRLTGQPVAEYVYITDPVAEAPDPVDDFRTNGLVELLATDNNGTLLALERSFSVGKGNTVKLYEARTQGALDVANTEDLFWEAEGEPFEIDPPIVKRLLVDFADLGITPDNLEGMTFGPTLPDGRRTLIVVSDNNFNDTQVTQFLALALSFATTPAVLPQQETPRSIDQANPPDNALAGDSDDPAIWVHPEDPAQSLVLAAAKDGGLVVFGLAGRVLQTILPAPFGEIRYNNVDLLYDFNLGGAEVDLAVASDRQNDTLAIFQIDPGSRQLRDVTAPDILETIFGVDDGEATAYGLATYTSPTTGKAYAFVTQADGAQVAQLELTDTGAGQVTATIVRTLQLPTPTGDAEDSQSEGTVVDRDLGFLYVAMEEEVGILKFNAEPDGGDDYMVIHSVDEPYLEPDIEGLTIYYGPNNTGYLLASSQGDNTFAVFDRQGDNPYLGSFTVGDYQTVDQANESDGAHVVNVNLGPRYPSGLLVVQDGANDPQHVVQDEEELENNSTNFKFVPWEHVATAFDPPLIIDPVSANPRAMTLPNGVAAGDTTQTSTVLWTRSTVPGDVTFEVAPTANFNTIVVTATATVTDSLQPVQVEITGLMPDTSYYYRATSSDGTMAMGRFRTFAETGTSTGLRFGVVGDWQQAPPFPTLANADERDLEFFLKLGDTIYADQETPALPGVSQARTLREFRIKQAENVTERFGLNTLADLYRTTSIFATIDDHELVDNFAGGAAPGESPDAPDIGSSPDPLFTDPVDFVNDTQAYENALQAFQEYHPINNEFYGDTGDPRTAEERRLYRYRTFGSDAALFILDTRSFRDAQIDPYNPDDPADITRFLMEAFDPTRTLLGQAQLEMLKADLLEAKDAGIRWKFIAVPEPIQNFGPATAEDRFEGYAAERTELLKFIDDNNIENVVFFAADFHGTIVNNLTYQLTPDGEQIPTGAFEIVTGPVAFFDGRFGPNVIAIATAFGLINAEQQAIYDTLPVAPDRDDLVNDKDDFVKQLLIQQTQAFGYDPVGLEGSGIDAELLQGDYVAAHNFGWTEVEIDATTGNLTVTVYGIEAYSEAELVANPNDITGRTPTVLVQFQVTPQDVPAPAPTGRTLYLPIVAR
jgi:3-phytase/alkaline phosphatase D